jgi:hypothetical protein
MIDSKFLLTLFAITFAICTVFKQTPIEFIKEGFANVNVSRTMRVMSLQADPMPAQESIIPVNGTEFNRASIPTLPPARTSGEGLKAAYWNCARNKPSDYATLAYAPDKPLTFNQAAASCANGSSTCGTTGINAVSDMSNNTVMTNPIIADRVIGVATKSRLASLGCPIRGDIVCTNVNTKGWFSVSADPTALRSGAIGIITDSKVPTGDDIVKTEVKQAMQRNVRVM